MATRPAGLKKAFQQLRAAAKQFPRVNEDFLWGESAFKVAKKKVFCFMRISESGDKLSTLTDVLPPAGRHVTNLAQA